MLNISAAQFDAVAKARAAERGADWIERELRESYGEMLGGLSDAMLRREIVACLDRAEAMGMTRPADRLGFCALDIVSFPGFRDLRGLPAMLALFATEAESALSRLVSEAPGAFWNELIEHAETVRRERAAR